jgi:hypothetical protein
MNRKLLLNFSFVICAFSSFSFKAPLQATNDPNRLIIFEDGATSAFAKADKNGSKGTHDKKMHKSDRGKNKDTKRSNKKSKKKTKRKDEKNKKKNHGH